MTAVNPDQDRSAYSTIFPKDYLTIITKATSQYHRYVPCLAETLSRKANLVEYGFRMQSAFDNSWPLRFEWNQTLTNQVIYVSATPADYELKEAGGIVVEQVIRPTGLLDPVIDVRPSLNQIDDPPGRDTDPYRTR